MIGLPGVLRRGIIQPKYILAIVVVLMVIMVCMGLYEMYASKQDITRILREEAASLAEAISIMSDNSLTCFGEIEYLVTERLLSNARVLERLDSENPLSEKALKDIADQDGINRICVYSEYGSKLLDSQPQSSLSESWAQVKAFLDGDEGEAIMDPEDHDGYIAAVRRRRGGAIVLHLDSSEMLEFRKSIGIGRLIQEIGRNEGIEYIVLQDENGLILASKNVTQMRRITGDAFLEDALRNKRLDMRTYLFNDREVTEVVSPFQIDDNSYGLFRIGLSMNEVRAVESRGRTRLVLTALVVLAVGIVSFSLLLVSQNHSLLSRAYDRIRTYTGMVLENIADGIIVSDRDGAISVFNRAAERIFDRSGGEMVGSSLDKLEPALKGLIDDAFSSEMPQQTSEITISLPASGERLLSVRTSRFAGIETETDSVVAIIRDVTETKMMEENLRRTEQLTAMGKLASAVAHEVRNPLNAISMIAQRLAREFAPQEEEEQYQELTSMIRTESARLNGIIKQFLDFARQPKLDRQPVSIEQLLDEIASLMEAQALEHGIQIHKGYSDLGEWIIDREQMKQVLLNILLNGIEAMPDGGVLSINGKVDNRMLHIEISDTGKGIPEEEIPRIFDLYFTTKEAGTGLGLSIAQRIITEHGGWLDVDSTPGSGTTFSIHLPAGAAAGG